MCWGKKKLSVLITLKKTIGRFFYISNTYTRFFFCRCFNWALNVGLNCSHTNTTLNQQSCYIACIFFHLSHFWAKKVCRVTSVCIYIYHLGWLNFWKVERKDKKKIVKICGCVLHYCILVWLIFSIFSIFSLSYFPSFVYFKDRNIQKQQNKRCNL